MRAASLSCILTLSAPLELCDTAAMAAAVFSSSLVVHAIENIIYGDNGPLRPMGED